MEVVSEKNFKDILYRISRAYSGRRGGLSDVAHESDNQGLENESLSGVLREIPMLPIFPLQPHIL